MKTIVIATFGSFGDVQPYLSIALELQRRGHQVTLATSNYYRAYVRAHQVGFHALRPDHVDNQQFLRQIMHPVTGPQYLLQQWLGSSVRQTYEDLAEVVADADLLINNLTSLAGPLVAERLDRPIIACALNPTGVQSVHDPLVISLAPWLKYDNWMGTGVYRALLHTVNRVVAAWLRPVTDLRRTLGLRPDRPPLPRLAPGAYATRSLALYDPVLGGPQPDWPAGTVQTGFPRLAQTVYSAHKPQVDAFFERGPAPVTFTLGTAAVQTAGSFYEVSASVLEQTGRRGLLLTGNNPDNIPDRLSTDLVAYDYLPLDYAFERSNVVVHQGGIGTCAQALYAGVPMIVVPHSHDQPDNAHRLERLGVARVIPARQYTTRRLRRVLDEVYESESMAQRAAELRASVAERDGVANACDQVEQVLACTAELAL